MYQFHGFSHGPWSLTLHSSPTIISTPLTYRRQNEPVRAGYHYSALSLLIKSAPPSGPQYSEIIQSHASLHGFSSRKGRIIKSRWFNQRPTGNYICTFPTPNSRPSTPSHSVLGPLKWLAFHKVPLPPLPTWYLVYVIKGHPSTDRSLLGPP